MRRCRGAFRWGGDPLLVVSLDGLPIRESRKIFLQAATRDKPHGYRTESIGDGFERITHPGGYPLNVENIYRLS